MSTKAGNAKAPRRQGAIHGRREPSPVVDALASQVVDAALEVHRELGPGLPESCYQIALARELTLRDVGFEREHVTEAVYKGVRVGHARLDFLIEGKLVVELKAVELIHEAHAAQTLTYCRMTGCELGLLLNFGAPTLKRGIKRIINNQL